MPLECRAIRHKWAMPRFSAWRDNRYTLCVNRFVRGSFAFGEIDLRCAGLRISYEWSRLGGGIAMAEDKEPFEALTVLDCSSCKMRCIGCGITF